MVLIPFKLATYIPKYLLEDKQTLFKCYLKLYANGTRWKTLNVGIVTLFFFFSLSLFFFFFPQENLYQLVLKR